MTARSIVFGVVAGSGLAAVVASVVGGLGGLTHLREQVGSDWPWLVVILAGFGRQVALLAELRHRRQRYRGASAAGAAGGGASAAGMIAAARITLLTLPPCLALPVQRCS